MEVIENPERYQQATRSWRDERREHLLVPTMGALHAGHARLIEEARRRAGSEGRVSVSLFVNPIQFNSAEDLAKYPRTLEADRVVCERLGVDVLFAPEREAMYGPDFQTHVEVGDLSGPLCGAHRPGHFRGVTTVVMKLLMLAQPTGAVFGWKDAQQFLILRRMVRDLAVPVEMIGVDTVREPDGLAMSSRNVRLSPEERAAAPLIYQGLSAARNLLAAGEHAAEKLLKTYQGVVDASPLLRTEYAELRSLETLEPLEDAEPGNTLFAVAVHCGPVRLIDNIRL